jgi:hypothetical protein
MFDLHCSEFKAHLETQHIKISAQSKDEKRRKRLVTETVQKSVFFTKIMPPMIPLK